MTDASTPDVFRQDIALLGAMLRQAVARFVSDDAAETVAGLEEACRARRGDESGAKTLRELMARVADMTLEDIETAARVYTLDFLLLNAAEQVDRCRQRGDERIAGVGSVAKALRALAAQGRSADEVRREIGRLEVRPVLTAHPTEATRKTLLTLQSRVADALLARDGAASDEREALDASLATDVELLWLTAEVVRARPSVRHEVITALWYLEDWLFDAAAALHERVDRAFEAAFGEPLVEYPKVSLGTWVAGDRDGNPFVTPEVTRSASRRASLATTRYYLERTEVLMERLSVSQSVTLAPASLWTSLEADRAGMPEVWASKGRWHDDEPLRLKLAYMVERLRRTVEERDARCAGHELERPGAYADAAGFLADLELVAETLQRGGAHRSRRMLIDPLVARVRLSGFSGFEMDVRQHSEVHTAALAAMTDRAQVSSLDGAGLRRELLGRRPLISAFESLDDERAERTREVFRTIRDIQRETGEEAARTYIISMTRSADDLLRVLLLGREAGLVDLAAKPPRSSIDVVPLFETGADLAAAPEIMKGLFADPVYVRQVEARGRHQEVMIGYSDSGKDIGLLPAAWSLYRAQESLCAVAKDAGVSLTLFHGLGGSVGRGGGSPVSRALSALPPGTVRDGIKITEQGEVISAKYGMPAIAEQSLEIMYSGSLTASMQDWRHEVPEALRRRFAQVMDEMAAVAMPVYRGFVHEGDALFDMFLDTTPVRELAGVHFGSRPVYRDAGAEKMAGIRAIPWTFGWTQMRLMLPVWLGLGTALETILEQPDGESTLREMARHWPFFDDLLSKVEMVLAKADLEIAGMYVEVLGGDRTLFDTLSEEFGRTTRALERIRGPGAPADAKLTAMLQQRSPLLDALAILQVHLMKMKRSCADEDPRRPRIQAALATTLSGIAQGLRNTG